MNRLPPGITPLIDAQRIRERLVEIAAKIARELDPAERPIAVVVLQGAFMFAADLFRALPPEFPLDMAFIRCQSYGKGTSSSGKVILLHDLDSDIDLHGRTVLLIDDILDTGTTIHFLTEHLQRRGAERVKLCVLLERASPVCERAVKADFCGFRIGAEFVVGFGLDFAGKYRHLPDLAALDESEIQR